MSKRADGVRVAYPLFQAEGGGSIPTSALDFWFRQTELLTARRLVKLWHSRLPRIDQRVAGWRCYVAEYEGVFYATAIWGLPIANMLPQDGSVLELRRLAIAPDSPKNTASRILGWMVRDIKRCMPEVHKLISYQDADVHKGTIYRASGWLPVGWTDYSPWRHASRPTRPLAQSESPKQRWEKELTR